MVFAVVCDSSTSPFTYVAIGELLDHALLLGTPWSYLGHPGAFGTRIQIHGYSNGAMKEPSVLAVDSADCPSFANYSGSGPTLARELRDSGPCLVEQTH